MRTINGGHFVIEYSEPVKRDNPAKPEHAYWMRNGSIGIICDTAERAIELLREHSADAVIHVVRRVGTTKTLLIDATSEPEPAEQPTGDES